MNDIIEHDDPAKLWKSATAFVRKKVPSGLRPLWLGPAKNEATAHIVRPPRPLPTTVTAKLRRKFRDHPPFVYTSFSWEEDGEWRCIGRTELCSAYLRLCDDYTGLRLSLLGLERLFRDNDMVTVEKELALKARFCREIDVLRARGSRLLPRLKFAVGNMAEFLRVLDRCEDRNRHPPVVAGNWARYSGPITTESVRLPEMERLRKLFRNGNMEDYAFRAAKIVNNSQTPESLRMLRREIEAIAVKMLLFKECEDAENMVYKYIPKSEDSPRPNPGIKMEVTSAIDRDSAEIIGSKDSEAGMQTKVSGSSAPPAYHP
ncbi:hypothetical protein A1Q1_03831 [Trichosporon asahii var. asahii CBS 2479]|uniref:Uncharacterized protein n=1 Tax=Trichosporon asahii var. asahii (strain ATCC 90039 / CBS 2479 / JCM 2466 / KCTC 7840 / NBRC 103889/ NCYC 2677 / UAMH 7654) TaxID=1186058 RepID=J4U9N2_TRIAS|nr:hypothetical protein A1Q1_03831 [Trichosporon asahii var. asahii CBS 2479]EJT47360.1 hypothetical protein A1Q1_03831 [Trichosporon asahii var. asahii CBS 2479]